MATTKEFADYIMEQLSLAGECANRKMMGEYVLYYKGKVFGGLYDNRLLVKITDGSKRVLQNAVEELPYEGAKMMLLMEETDNKELLQQLLVEMYDDLPEVKKRKKKTI